MSELKLGAAYEQAVALFPVLQETLHKAGSRYAGRPPDAGVLAQCASNCQGDYIEIGSLYGASAIVAALFGNGHVYCVDIFEPYSKRKDVALPSPELVLSNAANWGAEKKITPFKHRHPPLPEELEHVRFDIAFIDGDHTAAGSLADWENIEHRVDRYVLFHDVRPNSPYGALQTFTQHAMRDPNWNLIYRDTVSKTMSSIGVLERVK